MRSVNRTTQAVYKEMEDLIKFGSGDIRMMAICQKFARMQKALWEIKRLPRPKGRSTDYYAGYNDALTAAKDLANTGVLFDPLAHD